MSAVFHTAFVHSERTCVFTSTIESGAANSNNIETIIWGGDQMADVEPTRFEDKMPSELCSSDVDGLIGREENQRLDFKETIESGDLANRELARDICSFANAEGGYMVIGAREGGQMGVCAGFRSVENPEALCQRIRQVSLDCVTERVIGMEIASLSSSKGEILVAVYMPASSQKPHMVTKDGKTEFWKRYQTDKRHMTIAEVRDAFLQTAGSVRLQTIEAKVDSILRQREGQAEAEQQRVLAADRGRLNEVTDIQRLWDALDTLFKEAADGKRFLRLTITPEDLRKDLVDLEREHIHDLLINPPGQRQNGWNAKSPDPFLRSDSLGLRSSDESLQYGRFITLMRNGHFEFWKAIDTTLCWRQDDVEYQKQPRLYPHAITEYPVSFLRLSKLVYQHLKVSCGFKWRMIYWNLRGCTLLPYHPDAVGYHTAYGHTPVYADQHFVRDAQLTNDFAPDVEALGLIRELYLGFGYTRQHVPFFDENGRFQLK